MLLDDNPWQLYAGVDGWQECAARLDVAVNAAIARMEARIAEGASIPSAAKETRRSVLDILDRPENTEFGTEDSECRDHVDWVIGRHIKQRYGVTINT